MPPNATREENNKHEYGLWLAVDTKFHKYSKLLLTEKLDESGQITHINHIYADHLETLVPNLKLRGPSAAVSPPHVDNTWELEEKLFDKFLFLKELLGAHNNLHILLHSETVCNKRSIEFIRVKLGFFAFFFVERNGLRGGLTLFWYSNLVNLHTLSSSFGHIDAQITPTNSMPA